MVRHLARGAAVGGLVLGAAASLFLPASADLADLPAAGCWWDARDPLPSFCGLDLEVWSERKRSETFNLWELHCANQQCTLKETHVLILERMHPMFFLRQYSTSGGGDGRLRLSAERANDAGRVWLDITPTGWHVDIRLRFIGGREGSWARIERLEAKRLVGVHLEELRLPEYSYVRNVPVLLRGRKSGADKRREELERALTDRDREIFRRVGAACVDRMAAAAAARVSGDERLKARLKATEREHLRILGKQVWELENEDFEAMERLRAEDRRIGHAALREALPHFRKCLEAAGMSPEGSDLVVTTLAAALLEGR